MLGRIPELPARPGRPITRTTPVSVDDRRLIADCLEGRTAAFGDLVRRYQERYTRSPYLRGAYLDTLRERLRKIRARHGLASTPVEYRPDLWEDERQQELFPEE